MFVGTKIPCHLKGKGLILLRLRRANDLLIAGLDGSSPGLPL